MLPRAIAIQVINSDLFQAARRKIFNSELAFANLTFAETAHAEAFVQALPTGIEHSVQTVNGQPTVRLAFAMPYQQQEVLCEITRLAEKHAAQLQSWPPVQQFVDMQVIQCAERSNAEPRTASL